MIALEFPPLGHIVDWPELVGDNTWGINKVVIIYGLAALFTILLFTLGNKKQLVPAGSQNLAEMSVEFVEDQIVLPTLGHEGLKWTPYLAALFFFIFFCNIFEIIPFFQMPATARIALPMVLALLSYVLYHGAGFVEHGPFGYLKHALVPPGVPVALLLLVVPIEFISKFLVQPFSHTVRLFANLLAGHLLLLFMGGGLAVLLGLAALGVATFPLAFAFFVLEVGLIATLQAFIFATLTAIYIGGAVAQSH